MRTSPLVLGLAGLLLTSSQALAANRVLVGKVVQRFSGPQDDPMVQPTAVAPDGEGGIYAADGVNDRVLHWDRKGRLLDTISTVDGQPLSNPTAVATSLDGWLWIADTGNGRVAVVPPAPGLDQSIQPPAELADQLDLTGVAISPQADTLWLVDNDGHRVFRYDLGLERWQQLGSRGHGLGQLEHPFLAATGDEGDLWVTDVINGRLHSFSQAGDPLRTVGGFGVTPGELFRPKGVAIEGETVWASDGVLGVIQAFTTSGRLVDVLRDESGQILRLDRPMGLASARGELYVVELGTGQVVQLSIGRQAGRPYEASSASSGSSGEDIGCQACHLEMVPAMSRGVGNLLAPLPADSSEAPYVGTDAACLSCHDGSVLDSRHDVWHLHGHPVELEIPSDMEIPADLPLSGGEMACRTCHSAHTLGGSGQVHRNALMLRVSDDAEELCLACHGDMMDGGGQ